MSDASGLYGLAGVIIGAAITQGVAWWSKRKRHVSYWAALSAEVDLCSGLATAYVRDGVAAPLYRLPTIAYDMSFPALLGDGVVAHDDAKAMLRFYAQVWQINRGLEQAHAATDHALPPEVLGREAQRLHRKAEALIDPKGRDGGDSYYGAVRAAIDRHFKPKA